MSQSLVARFLLNRRRITVVVWSARNVRTSIEGVREGVLREHFGSNLAQSLHDEMSSNLSKSLEILQYIAVDELGLRSIGMGTAAQAQPNLFIHEKKDGPQATKCGPLEMDNATGSHHCTNAHSP